MKLKIISDTPVKQTGAPKPMTAVFIDYESLYYSILNKYGIPPDLRPLIDDLKQLARIVRIKVFGDFTKEDLDNMRNSIRTVTSDIIDCSSETTKKDYTDFIMLDHIYKEVLQNSGIDQYVIFTGDGHFSSVAAFLTTFMDKKVGIYGVPGTLSRQLTQCSTWVREISMIDEDDEVYKMNLIKNFRTCEQRGKVPTFRSLCERTSETYGGDFYRYKFVLQGMLSDGYCEKKIITYNGNEITATFPVWDRIEDELIKELAKAGVTY